MLLVDLELLIVLSRLFEALLEEEMKTVVVCLLAAGK